ncbi:MAG: DUF5706 domain-containing protein [Candidatus Eremiobacteraeota bacterium]|nr:DUF5706 domain-containing protein [Candidatus Eremiobacteraeota bacterium]
MGIAMDRSSHEPLAADTAGIDLKSAFDVLHYNQNLVQFADNKANNLIVINSIFLASATSFLMGERGAAKAFSGFEGIFQLGFFVASIAAIFYCLMVIMTKGDYSEKAGRTDLVFFGDILARKTADNYVHDFTRIKPLDMQRDILRRNFSTAQIAERKFSLIKSAQSLTLASSVLWVITIAMVFMK